MSAKPMTTEKNFLHDLTSPLMSAMLRLETQIATQKELDSATALHLQITLDRLKKISELIQERKREISADDPLTL